MIQKLLIQIFGDSDIYCHIIFFHLYEISMTRPTKPLGDLEYEKFDQDSEGNISIKYSSGGTLIAGNTTATALGSGATYTGTWTDVSTYTSVVTAVLSDTAGTLYMEFSTTGVGSADSTLTYAVAANINDVHKLTVTRQYYRSRFVNSASVQSVFNLSTLFGNHGILTAPLNLTLGQDADSIVARVISDEQDIAEGKRAGYSIVNKFGRNADVDSGAPADIWEGLLTYTGFPTGAAELVTVTSSSINDTSAGSGARTVSISGLDATGVEQTETVILAGTGLVDSANTYTRVNRVIVLTSGSSNQAFNAGILSVAHKTTTANIFAKVPIGFNQSQIGCYTIPLGKTGYLRVIQVWVKKSNTANIDGGIWIRENGASPRIVDIFSASQADGYDEKIYGGKPLPALTDIAIRVTAASTTNVEVICHFDIILVTD